jgi:hypothetical protein
MVVAEVAVHLPPEQLVQVPLVVTVVLVLHRQYLEPVLPTLAEAVLLVLTVVRQVRAGLVAEGMEPIVTQQLLREPLEQVAEVGAAAIHPLGVRAVTAAQESSSSKRTGKPMKKIYKLYGIDTAMAMLRPGAKWEISNSHFTRWDDPRPCPTWEEVQDTMEKIKAFEDSINTIYTEEQLKEHNQWMEMLNKAAA